MERVLALLILKLYDREEILVKKVAGSALTPVYCKNKSFGLDTRYSTEKM